MNSRIFLVGLIILSALLLQIKYRPEDAEEPVLSVGDAGRIARTRVLNDYNYGNLGGHNLHLTGTPVSCGRDCSIFTFKYDINESRITGVDSIKATVKIMEGEAVNFTYTELDEVDGFRECVDKGFEAFYPDCVGCMPYCIDGEGVRHVKQET